MENTKKQLNFWRCLAIIELIALLVIGVVFTSGRGAAPVVPDKSDEVIAEPLTLWTEGSAAKQKLIDYVTAVTDEKGADFIPVEDRIAVFDMDGTLACETYYTYYDTMMFIEYCLHDHPDKVSDELKEVAAAIKPGYVANSITMP